MWRDAWLPGLEKGQSAQSIDINYTLVSDLIDVNTYTWQADVVNSLFGSDQARRVLSMPLSRFTQEDEFLWQGDNTEEYLVRSGYKWLVSNTGDGTECANTSQNNELRVFYNRIWNLKLANKIKITFWRIANNFLPTLSNLVPPRVATSSWCPVCSDAEETVKHLFCDCAVITQVLNALLVPFAPSNNTNNWKLWLVKEFVNSSLDKCKLWMVVFWAVWFNRNSAYHEGVNQQAYGIVAFVKKHTCKNWTVWIRFYKRFNVLRVAFGSHQRDLK
ncbi:hypothetical protein ERO13_A11G162150v2 [Gossypium hirsutum]|uniref:Reverse transcriptase zinc-binding domain-containing protein n=1 Tax=Gossypium darwinii TaxID=34276 RepID=A0A5D2ELL0_GOSDA|nr:hypothetical protein ERO13_A11G162150v2 [Gossypium hirsutum]TYG94370.1 hypothetical protein ES288_A11G183800v1 [Gossypium darwinii]